MQRALIHLLETITTASAATDHLEVIRQEEAMYPLIIELILGATRRVEIIRLLTVVIEVVVPAGAIRPAEATAHQVEAVAHRAGVIHPEDNPNDFIKKVAFFDKSATFF